MPNHHNLDPYPIPKDKTPLFINEPEFIDTSIINEVIKPAFEKLPSDADNIRVYIPLDLSKEAILRRLGSIIVQYGEACEENEFYFSRDVYQLVSQIEIYDEVWYIRHMPKEGEHSREVIELVTEFVAMLEEIPDACAETFPFELIDELKGEYLGI